MFRRKDEIDNLFDTASDSLQAHAASVDAAAPQAVASAPVSAAPSNGNGAMGQANGQPANRPAQDTRSAPVQTAVGFRPNATPINNDLTRNRMPEAKTPLATNVVIGTASAVMSSSVEKTGKPGRRVLTVGNDILLKGEIATCDRLVIEGKVDATLNDVHTVEIAENGSFKGSAQIEDAEISGIFEGDLIVRNRLVIYATGKVRGKITYGEIEIERGGELTGEIKTVASQQATAGSRPARTNATAAKEPAKFEAA